MSLRALLVFLLFFNTLAVSAESLKATANKANRLGISPRASEIKPRRTFGIVDLKFKKKIENRIERQIPPQVAKTRTPQAPLMLAPTAITSMNSPLVSFDGMINQDNQAVGGGAFAPPDTVGDVGPNHYVQMVNSLVEVFDKKGNSLEGPFELGDLFPANSDCAFDGLGEADDGDPVVVYDELADRWLLSQFFVDIPSAMCMAISTSSDPTGAYFVYEFPHLEDLFGDYPKIGVWPDAYYVTVNNFNEVAYNSAGVFAFDRADMLAGNTTDYQYIDVPNLFSLLPADVDGPTAPPGGAPAYIATSAADEFGDASDGIHLFEFDVDFANVNNTTFTDIGIVTANTDVDPLLCLASNGNACVKQKGSKQKLDSLNIMTMFRLQYRNFTTHETLVVNHTVDPDNTDRAGIRYYVLDRVLPAGSFTVAEQGTHQIADTSHRWMGSAAIDKDGNLAIGYSVSGPDVFPSIRYAGRHSTDTPGLLAQGEKSLIAGTGTQKGFGGSRWGDYSALTVDPVDDCTFWFTTEYYSGPAFDSDWRTRIGSFRFGIDLSPASLPIALNTQAYNQALTPSSGTGPFTFTIVDGALPNGLNMSAAGVISGIPNDTDGEYDITVHVAATTPSPTTCRGSGDRTYTLRLGCTYCDDYEDGVEPNYVFTGVWDETGGNLQATASGKARAIATPAFAAGCSTCTVEVDVKTGGGAGNKIWIFGWRSPDGKSQMELLMKEEADKWILKQRVGFVVAKQGAPFPIVPGQNYHVAITFDGNVFQVSVDGNTIITMPRAGGFPVPTGTVGFQLKATTGTFGSILVF